jgi:hypothetical protein
MPVTLPDDAAEQSSWFWTAIVLLASAPVVAVLCLTLWRTPFPVSEAVALFEDVANQPPSRFLIPDTAYYRSLFQITLGAIWHNAGSLAAKLAWIRIVHLVPLLLLVVLFVVHVRPRTFVEAAAAAVGVAPSSSEVRAFATTSNCPSATPSSACRSCWRCGCC